jgi:hypothetical protein
MTTSSPRDSSVSQLPGLAEHWHARRYVLYVNNARCCVAAAMLLRRVMREVDGSAVLVVRNVMTQPVLPEQRIGVVPLLERQSPEPTRRMVVHHEDENSLRAFLCPPF